MRFLAMLAGGAMLLLASGGAFAGEGSGTFSGLSGHETSGGVEVARTDSGWEIRLGEDFSFDGAPDPRVGFGSAGSFAEGTDFEALRADSGAQVYRVPAGIGPEQYDEVYIWCRQFSVPLGVARLE
jgi:hypothetical protein